LDTWVLLSYTIPRVPTARRLRIWRKLKRLQALLIDGGVWALPSSPRTQEEFHWLAAEIIEMGGKATLWEARLLWAGQDRALRKEFLNQVDAQYQEILTELEGGHGDLAGLARRYQQIRMQDRLGSELGKRVREVLLAARRGVGE